MPMNEAEFRARVPRPPLAPELQANLDKSAPPAEPPQVTTPVEKPDGGAGR